jgi:plasmid stabilization system protein ParE
VIEETFAELIVDDMRQLERLKHIENASLKKTQAERARRAANSGETTFSSLSNFVGSGTQRLSIRPPVHPKRYGQTWTMWRAANTCGAHEEASGSAHNGAVYLATAGRPGSAAQNASALFGDPSPVGPSYPGPDVQK